MVVLVADCSLFSVANEVLRNREVDSSPQTLLLHFVRENVFHYLVRLLQDFFFDFLLSLPRFWQIPVNPFRLTSHFLVGEDPSHFDAL